MSDAGGGRSARSVSRPRPHRLDAGDRNTIPAGGARCRSRESREWSSGTVNCPTPRRQGWRRAGSFMNWPSAPGTATSRRSWLPVPTKTRANVPQYFAQANFWHVFYQPAAADCSGSGTTRARASAPASSTTTSTVTAPPVRLKVRSGAWNTGWHDGSGFTQRISSSTLQRTLTRLGRDQPGHRRRPPQCGRHRSPRPGCVPPARASPSCGPRPAATFSGATPGCSAATTISTRPPTSWIRQWRAYHLIPPDYALPAN